MSDEYLERLRLPVNRRPDDYPLHIQVLAVMASGEVVSLEMPVDPGDQAGFTLNVDEAADGSQTFVQVGLFAQYAQRPPGEGKPYRLGTFGGAAPDGEMPGREVPDWVVAHLAQLLAGWSPPGHMPRGSQAYNQAVRGQATLTAQWLWQQAFVAGLHAAERMGMFRQRIIGPIASPVATPLTIPLFAPGDDGKPNWLPPKCPEPDCGQRVDDLEASLTDLAEVVGGKGRRQVTAKPCGHLIWVPDPIEVTLG